MASSKEFVNFVLEQLSGLEQVASRAMMGEYIIYYKEKIVGGIYDNRFLVKPVESAISFMPEVIWQLPYQGAKKMLLVENIDDRQFMEDLLNAMYDELPLPKKKKKSS